MTELLGPSIAKQVIVAGTDIDQTSAIRWGLAIDGGSQPLDTANRLAAEVAAKSPSAVAHAKHTVDRRMEDLSLARERENQAMLYAERAKD